jgi:NAD(P) transhydrogenase
MNFDAVILGSDPAGCSAALEASEQGLRVLFLPDAQRPTQPWSCFVSSPLHLLRESVVQRLSSLLLLEDFPAESRLREFPLQELWERQQELAASQLALFRERLERLGVVVDPRPARFLSAHEIQLGRDERLAAEIVVVATGSRPRRPRRFPFDDRIVCDPDSLLRAGRPPRNLLVLGAEGAGCELACVFGALGSSVTIVDRRDRALRYVDPDLLEVLHERMRELGIDVVLGESLDSVEVNPHSADPHATLRLASGRVEKCDRLVVAAGRQPNVENLGLAEAEIQGDRYGFVITDERLCTSQPGVYAAGGVISDLGQRADAFQGRAAIRAALGFEVDAAQAAPLTIYTIPEISMLGMTEEMCGRLDFPSAAGSARFEDLLMGRLRSERRGVLKLVANRATEELLGVQIVGRGAAELIHFGGALLRRGETLREVTETIFNSPSLSEAYWWAARNALDRLGRRRVRRRLRVREK